MPEQPIEVETAPIVTPGQARKWATQGKLSNTALRKVMDKSGRWAVQLGSDLEGETGKETYVFGSRKEAEDYLDQIKSQKLNIEGTYLAVDVVGSLAQYRRLAFFGYDRSPQKVGTGRYNLDAGNRRRSRRCDRCGPPSSVGG